MLEMKLLGVEGDPTRFMNDDLNITGEPQGKASRMHVLILSLSFRRPSRLLWATHIFQLRYQMNS
jgi:hypothetical protein